MLLSASSPLSFLPDQPCPWLFSVSVKTYRSFQLQTGLFWILFIICKWCLFVNSFLLQTNLVASGANESEIYIWDLNNFATPMTPGAKTQVLHWFQCNQKNQNWFFCTYLFFHTKYICLKSVFKCHWLFYSMIKC